MIRILLETRGFAVTSRQGALIVLTLCASCNRETRVTRVSPTLAQMTETVTLTDLRPGPSDASVQGNEPSAQEMGEFYGDQYESNAYLISEGKKLYFDFNCVGCHSNGGGGMGPPLMDEHWIYGHRPEQIFSTILQGRPNGMPAYQGRLNHHQTWQLVAYVRALGGLTESGVAPGRSDGLQGRLPEHTLPRQTP